jgi:hypothetical protein
VAVPINECLLKDNPFVPTQANVLTASAIRALEVAYVGFLTPQLALAGGMCVLAIRHALVALWSVGLANEDLHTWLEI